MSHFPSEHLPDFLKMDLAVGSADAHPLVGVLDVWFADENNGYAVGAYNLIFRTRDGGMTWESWFDRTENPKFFNLYAIRPVAGTLRAWPVPTPPADPPGGPPRAGDPSPALARRGASWPARRGPRRRCGGAGCGCWPPRTRPTGVSTRSRSGCGSPGPGCCR